MSCSIEDAMRAMAFVFMSVRLGVGRLIILLALMVMDASLERFLTEMLLKEQVQEQSNRMGWMMLIDRGQTNSGKHKKKK